MATDTASATFSTTPTTNRRVLEGEVVRVTTRNGGDGVWVVASTWPGPSFAIWLYDGNGGHFSISGDRVADVFAAVAA